MKKSILYCTMGLLFGLFGCSKGGAPKFGVAPFAADTALTADELAARKFTPEIMLKMGRLSGSTLSPDGKTLLYAIGYQSVRENRSYTALWTMDMATLAYTQITGYDLRPSDASWSVDGSAIYFINDGQLCRIAPDGSKFQKLSNEEGGISGYGIAPKGNGVWVVKNVAVEKVATSEIYPKMDKSKGLVYNDLMVRHWDVWEDGIYSHVFVGTIENDQVVGLKDIMAGEPYDAPGAPYYDNAEIAWNHAGTALAYTCRKLTGYQYAISTNTDLFLYTVADGSTRNLTEGMPGYDKYPRFSPDDSHVAWQSMERAGNESDKDRLFVMNLASGEKRYLTRDFDYNASNLVWSADGQTIYFLAPIEATVQLCSIPAAGGTAKVITKGLHDFTSLSMVGEQVVCQKTTLSSAAEAYQIDLATGIDTQITKINQRIYDAVDLASVEKRWVTTTDGKQMLTWVIKPPHFDATKKYPSLLFCQGGPQSVVSQAWSYRWNFQVMASDGYVVVAPNRRGLPSFGQEWLDQISGDYSGQNIKDLLSAIDDVSTESYIDKARRGCVGASYGGYSVFYLAGKHEGRFSAFISHCGIFNFTSMYGSTEELFFLNNDYGGAYWDFKNATAMRSYANSPHHFVQNWTTPILIITGLKDYRIPYTQSLEAFTGAKALGVDARLVAFEDEAHQVFGAQNAIVWHTEFLGWLNQYLK